MLHRNLSKIAMAVLGLCFVLMGGLCLLIFAIGDFATGRNVAGVMGYSLLIISLPFFAFLFSRQLFKALGMLVLLAFAAAMVWLAFLPTTPAANPAIYQAAAIALAVLLLARVGLRFRRKRSQPGT